MGQPNLKGILPDKAVQVITQMATALTTLTTQFISLSAKPLVTKPEADTAYGPAAQVKALQVSGSNPLNVTGLLGQLSQTQLAGIPSFTSIPTSGKYSQPGTLIYVNGVLTIVTTPGSGTSAGAVPTGPAGGDLAGTYPNPILKTVNSDVGTFGDATHTATITVDGKGRITAISSNGITFPAPTSAQIVAALGFTPAESGTNSTFSLTANLITGAVTGTITQN